MRPVRPVRLLKPATTLVQAPQRQARVFSLRQILRIALLKRSQASALQSSHAESVQSFDPQIDHSVTKEIESDDQSECLARKTTIETEESRQSLTQVLASSPTPQRIARAFLQDNHTSLALRYLASHIGDFCATLSADNQGPWEADLELNGAILPATHLWIRLSYQELTLRFACREKAAHDLVWMGQSRLRDMLQPILHAPCEVVIHVE